MKVFPNPKITGRVESSKSEVTKTTTEATTVTAMEMTTKVTTKERGRRLARAGYKF